MLNPVNSGKILSEVLGSITDAGWGFSWDTEIIMIRLLGLLSYGRK